MYTEKMSRITEKRNGIRQPQSANCSVVITPPNRQMPMIASARKRPSVAVVWIQAVS